MSELEAALVGIARSLDELGVPYAVIDGMANAVWGEPRLTLDVDVTVRVEDRRLAKVVAQLAGRFRSLASDPGAFVATTSVLPLRSPAGVRIDVIFARLPFEEEAVRRAVPIELGGAQVNFCTAEDLILMKIPSERQRDLDDARGVALRRMRELDREYLEPRIRELSVLLGQPDIMERWSAWKREVGSPEHDTPAG